MSARRRGRNHRDPAGQGAQPELRAEANAPSAAPFGPPVGVVEEPPAVPAALVLESPSAPDAGQRRPACTLAQLRRFIKSRPYVPLHELRRRFGIEGYEDEVSSFDSPSGQLYVGLPPAEAQLLGDLVRSGEVGCELLLDPTCPGVVGVFPMRPIARS